MTAPPDSDMDSAGSAATLDTGRPARQRPTVSVYIPCYNAERTIGACIASLLAQRLRPDEILVIDDGSTDRSQNLVRRFPGVTLIAHPKNLGLATARNTGLRESKGDLVASIDSDCAADPQWLATLVKAMFADPTLLGVAGSVAEVERITMADRWRARHMKQHYGMREVVNPRFLFGANTIYRREVLEKVGPYPTRLRTNGEDLEICVRIYKEIPGAVLKYIPTAVVSHLRRDTLSSLASTYWKYQTYLKWAFFPKQRLSVVLKQLHRIVRVIWLKNLPEDLRKGLRESVIVSLYLTVAITRHQMSAYWASRKLPGEPDLSAPSAKSEPDRA